MTTSRHKTSESDRRQYCGKCESFLRLQRVESTSDIKAYILKCDGCGIESTTAFTEQFAFANFENRHGKTHGHNQSTRRGN